MTTALRRIIHNADENSNRVGEGIRVSEYIIKIKENSKKQEIELDERDFIDIVSNPIALAIDKIRIRKGDAARMFICEQNKGDYDSDKNPTIKINKGYVEWKYKNRTKRSKKWRRQERLKTIQN